MKKIFALMMLVCSSAFASSDVERASAWGYDDGKVSASGTQE